MGFVVGVGHTEPRGRRIEHGAVGEAFADEVIDDGGDVALGLQFGTAGLEELDEMGFEFFEERGGEAPEIHGNG